MCQRHVYVYGDPINETDLSGKMQSCDNAVDDTGLHGAGLGTLTSTGGGYYVFDVQLWGWLFPRWAVITSGSARLYVNGQKSSVQINTGHPRGANEHFHSRQKLVGRGWSNTGFWSTKTHYTRRGDVLQFRISLTVVDVTSGETRNIRGRITCKL